MHNCRARSAIRPRAILACTNQGRRLTIGRRQSRCRSGTIHQQADFPRIGVVGLGYATSLPGARPASSMASRCPAQRPHMAAGAGFHATDVDQQRAVDGMTRADVVCSQRRRSVRKCSGASREQAEDAIDRTQVAAPPAICGHTPGQPRSPRRLTARPAAPPWGIRTLLTNWPYTVVPRKATKGQPPH